MEGIVDKCGVGNQNYMRKFLIIEYCDGTSAMSRNNHQIISNCPRKNVENIKLSPAVCPRANFKLIMVISSPE